MRASRKLVTTVALAVSCGMAYAGNPLKVYVLVGQSNMQGQANVSTAKHMAADPKTKPLYDKLFDADGKAKVFNDVRIAAFSQGRDNADTGKNGALTGGYGRDASDNNVCGPELAFGVTMHDIVKQPILLIKTSWGGKSLYRDFRPPSAGALQDAKDPEAVGHYYRLMVKHVKTVLADPGKYHPAYNQADGYEIAGFVWFQGWNDLVDGGFYKNRHQPGGYDDYTKVMKLFIADVRKEFETPKMPFVIGVLGVGGPTKLYTNKRYQGIHQYFRDAMAAPANDPELKDAVKAVLTENFWPHDVEKAEEKASAFGKEAQEALKKEQEKDPKLTGKAAYQWQQDYAKNLMEKNMTVEERLALSGKSNQGFHYLGSLKFYSQAGEAFAKAIATGK